MQGSDGAQGMDLTTKYMGLSLKSPLIASASPLNRDLGNLRALEDHGAGAVVLPSIFEEEILAERREIELRVDELPASGFAEAQTYFPASTASIIDGSIRGPSGLSWPESDRQPDTTMSAPVRSPCSTSRAR